MIGDNQGLDMTTMSVSGEMRTMRISVSRVPMSRPLTWLARGWADMRRNWGASLGYGALIVAIGWTVLIFCGTHPYFVAAAFSGFLLVAPMISAAFSEMSRRYAAGQQATFDDSLAGFSRRPGPLFAFGGLLAAVRRGLVRGLRRHARHDLSHHGADPLGDRVPRLHRPDEPFAGGGIPRRRRRARRTGVRALGGLGSAHRRPGRQRRAGDGREHPRGIRQHPGHDRVERPDTHSDRRSAMRRSWAACSSSPRSSDMRPGMRTAT